MTEQEYSTAGIVALGFAAALAAIADYLYGLSSLYPIAVSMLIGWILRGSYWGEEGE